MLNRDKIVIRFPIRSKTPTDPTKKTHYEKYKKD